ncbi:pirin family protein [Winogradskyella schleiferi]|uniref:pirin family protein n=1 Tax=Winogradskyella schleiferi TaxID=2686078 RepID=UPI0015B9068A|nr:pirin family protein [Winogradskyella schleiferi]
MKKIIHKAESRGFANHGWLQANHSFSFASWNNPERVHFGALRVLNDDIIAPKMGFGTHPHENMEIITIPLKGVLKHRDNMNNDWQPVVPGEVQVMSAGTGVQHSEINGSSDEHLSLFQIWIIPQKRNVQPRYDQKMFKDEDRKGKLQTLVTSFEDENENSLKIHQDVKISRIDLLEGNTFDYVIANENQGVYVLSIFGKVEIEGETLDTRDAIGVSEAESFNIKSKSDCELLLIEVPMMTL